MSGILSELKEANDLINTNDKIEGDIVFNGDASKWKKLINSFRLKILITLSNGRKLYYCNRICIYCRKPTFDDFYCR
jgi:hypothetical protein